MVYCFETFQRLCTDKWEYKRMFKLCGEATQECGWTCLRTTLAKYHRLAQEQKKIISVTFGYWEFQDQFANWLSLVMAYYTSKMVSWKFCVFEEIGLCIYIQWKG